MGISTDARPAQTVYSNTLGNLPYPLLSDFHPKGQVSKLYGVYNEERGAANRAVFIIDKQGIVRFKQTYANAADLKTSDILAAIDKL